MPPTPPRTVARARRPADPVIERKATRLRIKSLSGAGSGEAQAYFATFGDLDRANEIIEPGAFKNLDTFIRDGFIAFAHDWNALPIGTPTSAVQDARGLLVTFAFHSTPAAQAARTVFQERMARGKAVKSSIGYEVVEDAHEQRDGRDVRLLKSIDIYECSIVNVPCNPLAEGVEVRGAMPGGPDWTAVYRQYSGSLDTINGALDAKAPTGRVPDWSAVYRRYWHSLETIRAVTGR